MKTKKIALINGIVGLVGGIFLLIAVLIITASALNDVATTLDTAYNGRSEEHTSELQSRFDIVCRHLLEKNKHCLSAQNQENMSQKGGGAATVCTRVAILRS